VGRYLGFFIQPFFSVSFSCIHRFLFVTVEKKHRIIHQMEARALWTPRTGRDIQPTVLAPDEAAAMAASVMDGLMCGLVRSIPRVEQFMQAWMRAMPVNETMTGTIYDFIERIMTSEIDFHIESESLFFTKCSEIRIYYKQLKSDEVPLVMYMIDNWEDFFEKMVVTTIRPTLIGCLFNDIVQRRFPRAEICARYLSCLLLSALPKDNSRVASSSFYYLWHACKCAIVRLQMRYGKKLRGALALLTSVINNFDALTMWNPDTQMHP
jgi:hypothetical protein